MDDGAIVYRLSPIVYRPANRIEYLIRCTKFMYQIGVFVRKA